MLKKNNRPVPRHKHRNFQRSSTPTSTTSPFNFYNKTAMIKPEDLPKDVGYRPIPHINPTVNKKPLPASTGLSNVLNPLTHKAEQYTKRENKDFFRYSYLQNVPSVNGGMIGEDQEILNNIKTLKETGKASEEHIKKISAFDDLLLALTQDDVERWEKEWTYKARRYNPETGKIELTMVLKPNAQPPEHFTPEEKAIWRYGCKFNDIWTRQETEAYLKEEERKHMKAESTDYSLKVNNSYLDVARTFFNQLSDGTSIKDASVGLWEDLGEYHKQYVLNPIRKGEFGLLAKNVSVNLGETLDYAGLGVRAAFGSIKGVYGANDTLIEGQEEWVYSGGKQTQEELIKLGALDLIKFGDNLDKRGRRRSQNKESILQAIENAGLTDEFNKFKEEYYNEDFTGDTLEAVKEAYTTHKNFSADTGSVVKNIITELVLDPSLVVGGLAKTFSSIGVDSITRGGVHAGLTKIIKDPEQLSKILDLTDEVSKKYFRAMNENIFSVKTRDNVITENIQNISNKLLDEGVLTKADQINFEKLAIGTIKQNIDSTTFRLIQGIKLLDQSIDAIDSTLLKGVFGAPYLGYKGLKLIKNNARTLREVYNKVLPYKDYVTRQAASRVQEGIKDIDGSASILDIDEYSARLGTEYTVSIEEAVFDETFEMFEKGFNKFTSEVQRIKNQIIPNKVDKNMLDTLLDETVFKFTRDTFTTASSFKHYLEQTQFKYTGKNDRIVKLCTDYIRTIDNVVDLIENSAKVQGQVKIKDTIGKVSDIVTPWSDADLLMKGTVTKETANVFKDVAANIYIPKGVPQSYADLSQYIFKLVEDPKGVDLREFRQLYENYCRDYTQRMARKDSKNIDKAAEKNYKLQLERINNQIYTTELSTAVKRDTQLITMQVDKLATFDKYLSDPTFKTMILQLLSKEHPVGAFLHSIVAKPSAWKTYDKLVGIRKFSERMSSLLDEIDSAKAVMELREDLSMLPDKERWAVLESLFGLSKGAPKDYARMTLNQRDDFINKVELWLNSNYGESKVSLDGFSEQAIDFNSDLYKNFADEITDVNLQQRIKEIVQGGHIEPIKDVQKQMLQIILKDPDSIAYYNELSKRQEVFFTDIETLGLNSKLHEVTSVAMKTWVDIPENASLKEILDIIQDSSTEQIFKSYYSEEFIRQNVSDEILNVMFKNDLRVPDSREYRLQEYIKHYGKEANNKAVTEAELLSSWLHVIDKSYVKHGNNVPVLVVHNNNGFDTNFLRNRCIENKGYTSYVDHLSSLVEASVNTLKRLKELEKDVILTTESKEIIVSSVEKCMNKLKHKHNMTLFSPEKIETGLRVLDKELLNKVDKWEDNPFLNLLKQHISQGNFSTMHETFRQTNKAIMRELKIFKDNIVVNPFSIKLKNLGDDELKLYFTDDELAIIKDAVKNADSLVYRRYNEELLKRYLAKNYKVYAKSEIDNLMRMLKTMNDSEIPPLGYRILFDDTTVSRFFNTVDGFKYSELELKGMQEFSESVINTINKRLKANVYIGEYMKDWTTIIQQARYYASQLEPFSKLSYLKYLEVPSTVTEAYVMAQKIWDIVDDAELATYISKDARNILSNVRGNYHHQIYNDVVKDYFTPYMVDLVEDNLAFRNMLEEVKKGKRTYSSMATWLDESPYASAKDLAFLQVYTNYTKFLEYFKELTDKNQMITLPNGQQVAFFKQALKDISAEMNVRRQAMTAQIMEHIIKSEDNLIAHLMFHNQFLNIPLKGSLLHMRQVEDLLKQLGKYDTAKINYVVHGEFLHISLKNGNRLEILNDGVPEEVTKMRFEGGSKEYTAPNYQRIKIDTPVGKYVSFDADPNFAKMYADLDDQIFKLTGGASAGSVGALHTFNKQKKLYKLLPDSFIRNAMTENYTCDARLWHGASFDMTNLGDIENCWKYGEVNDIDPLIIMKENLDEIRRISQSERVLIDSMFGDFSELKLRDVFGSHLTGEQKLEVIGNLKDYTCVVLSPARTVSGYRVDEVRVIDKTSLEVAENHNAIFIPYNVYLELDTALNQQKLTNTALKIFAKYTHYVKCGQLMFPGTWIRNWLDATIKSIGDTGSVTETVAYQLEAINLINNYRKVVQHFEKNKSLSYYSLSVVRREIENIPGVNITYEQFEFLDGWFKNNLSGGESNLVKSFLEKGKGTRNQGLKQGSTTSYAARRNAAQQWDTIASDIERFEDLEYDEVVSLCKTLKLKDFVESGISEQRFLEGFVNPDVLTSEEWVRWNILANTLIQIRSKRMVNTSLLKEGISTLDSLVNKMMHPMSEVERIVRLGEYLALEAQGYKQGAIFKKITASQFNYDNKTAIEKIIELVIPYYTFEKCNMLYWSRQISENPRMLRYLEHFWGQLSWENAEVDDEERMTNYAVQSVLNKGNIPLGDSGLYFKANPSFLSALDLVTGGPQQYLSKMGTLFNLLTRFSLKQLGAETNAFFSEVEFGDGETSVEEVLETLWDLVPIGPIVWNKFDAAFAVFDKDAPYLRLAEEAREGWQGALVRCFPSVFGAVTYYNNMGSKSFEDFQEILAGHGKWYDANLDRIVSIEEMNNIGLNSSDLDWDEVCNYMLLYRNKVWDANVGEFVSVNDFTPGGLNRKFNFDIPGEWDEFCRLQKLYHGKVWDANQNDFVKPEDVIPGMLNDPNLSWDEVCYYNMKLFGRVYDANQGRFINVVEKYIPGGLNSKDLEWDELTALQYVIHGKVWDYASHQWVKVTEPQVEYTFDAMVPMVDEVVREDKESILSKLGVVMPVYADNLQRSAEYKTNISLKNSEGKYLLTGDAEHDQKVFALIKSEFASENGLNTTRSAAGNSSYMKYRNGNAGGYNYKAKAFTPNRKPYAGVVAGGKLYGRPFSAGKNLAALKMATSKYTSYDIYYDFDYNYSYNYRHTVSIASNYPQSQLALSRYKKDRGEALLRNFQNRNKYDLDNSHSVTGLSTEQRLNKLKYAWYR